MTSRTHALSSCLALAAAATTLATLLSAGCGTAGGANATYRVTVTDTGTCLAAGRSAPAAELPALLKSIGAGHDSRIEITVPQRAPTDPRQLAATLARAGYRRVYCVRPRTSTAYVGKPETTRPPR